MVPVKAEFTPLKVSVLLVLVVLLRVPDPLSAPLSVWLVLLLYLKVEPLSISMAAA
jgi:hypothetical protein